jgi:FkbM family methyltransferase
MINYARSGGTLLNKCFGVSPNVIILSEVHPDGGGWGELQEASFVTVWDQTKNWYNIELKSRSFPEAIEELLAHCNNNGKHLIIREWTYLNFHSSETYNNIPAFDFKTLNQLKHLQPIVFCFVRDAIDVWLSRGKPQMDMFFNAYLSYVKLIKKYEFRVFKFEDFARSPEATFREICNYIGVQYDSSFISRYKTFVNVNGDVQKKNKSRVISYSGISSKKRRPLGHLLIKQLNRHAPMAEANRLLNYPTSYYQNRFASILHDSLVALWQKALGRNQKKHTAHPELKRWRKDQGDRTLRLEYPELNPESLVFDLGGYKGDWAFRINRKYDCRVWVFEPVRDFIGMLFNRFRDTPKITVFPFGLAGETTTSKVSVQGNASSIFLAGVGPQQVIELQDIADFIRKNDIRKIDLLKINIEGAEYDLLERLVETGLIKMIHNIQVQFHDFVDQAETKMQKIQASLELTHERTYHYRFVWENWRLKN